MQHVAERRPHEPGLRMRAGPQLRKTLGQIPVLQDRNDGFIDLACRRTIVILCDIKDLDFLAGLAIHALA